MTKATVIKKGEGIAAPARVASVRKGEKMADVNKAAQDKAQSDTILVSLRPT
jgi:hypothetical protein